jgi:ferritin-like metal-binding protein YciE
MPALSTLHDLFIHELQDVASAEAQLVKALPKMAKAVKNPELREAMEEHLEETKNHLKIVTEMLKAFDADRGDVTCEAMKGLIEEGENLLKEDADPAVLDAAIIAAAQKIEHYEIATYGTLRAWADQLEETDAAESLDGILSEETATDERLTAIAETANQQAE